MPKHILPADDTVVADITEAMLRTLHERNLELGSDIHEASETGQIIIDRWKGIGGGIRRFRVELVELTDA